MSRPACGGVRQRQGASTCIACGGVSACQSSVRLVRLASSVSKRVSRVRVVRLVSRRGVLSAWCASSSVSFITHERRARRTLDATRKHARRLELGFSSRYNPDQQSTCTASRACMLTLVVVLQGTSVPVGRCVAESLACHKSPPLHIQSCTVAWHWRRRRGRGGQRQGASTCAACTVAAPRRQGAVVLQATTALPASACLVRRTADDARPCLQTGLSL